MWQLVVVAIIAGQPSISIQDFGSYAMCWALKADLPKRLHEADVKDVRFIDCIHRGPVL